MTNATKYHSNSLLIFAISKIKKADKTFRIYGI